MFFLKWIVIVDDGIILMRVGGVKSFVLGRFDFVFGVPGLKIFMHF
jgi:hypothetical protein